MFVIYFAAGLIVLVVLIVLIVWVARTPPAASPAEAFAAFAAQRSGLERMFFEAASATGKPRGLRWKSCEFGADVEIARDRSNGELTALVPVTIAFEAIPGSDMEGLPAVGNLRTGCAVFTWRDRRWLTAGRALLNLSPAEALRHFANQYEPADSSSADSRKTV